MNMDTCNKNAFSIFHGCLMMFLSLQLQEVSSDRISTNQSLSGYQTIVSSGYIATIQASTGMTCGALPVRYLGVPLTSKKLNLSNCEPLLHQIKTRLSSWSVKTLSFSGRLLLIKTVIGGITTFWCSAFILPKACIARINSLCSVFLWKGNIDSHNTARAWQSWCDTKGVSIVDEALGDSYSSKEAMRCTHIALLCVQDHPKDRPTISQIGYMFNNDYHLQYPKQPTFTNALNKDQRLMSHCAFSMNEATQTTMEGR
ncbi:unnamed protein product [Brassica napus]|uniref:(rape) hypothetical protein n=1 Tax=Brassica napus TaxID=3708 RepID=A0A816KIW4_BRANA|nr:unnamed protein product [Brassica napus]